MSTQRTGTAVAVCVAAGWYLGKYDPFDLSFVLVDKVGMPLLRLLNAEDAHTASILAAKWGLLPRDSIEDELVLHTRVWGLSFPNPVGLAAGYDKHAEAVGSLMDLGFGFVEVGSVCALPQPGNDKPRLFRLSEDTASINRFGFNSHGMELVSSRLQEFQKSKHLHRGGLVGLNAGKNKTVAEADAANAYSAVFETAGQYANYLVVNVSSPNTPGLRALQRQEVIKDLLVVCLKARDVASKAKYGHGSSKKIPLLVKIAPDLTMEEKEHIAQAVLSSGVDGMIVSNTTVSRPDTLTSPHKGQAGGLSGAPLRDMATRTVKDMYKLTNGRVPIIGVGGVATGQDAFEKILAGASLVQMYTMLIYTGPGQVRRVKRELAQLLLAHGFESVDEAVGKWDKVDYKRT